MASENNKNNVVSTLKEWAAPTLIGIVGMLVWRDVTELRTDVKLLLYNQSANEVKIQKLEIEVKELKQQFLTFSQNNSRNTSENPSEYPKIYAIKDDEYKFIPEKKHRL